jgi:hypothetical protein
MATAMATALAKAYNLAECSILTTSRTKANVAEEMNVVNNLNVVVVIPGN